MIVNLSDQFNKIMEAWHAPGFALAVVRGGEVILSQGFGYRDVERNLKVTPYTRFAIGSATKAFTTMAMAILVDERKLDWDTPVRCYLPAFRLHDLFATDRITPRDLVTHRSGLPRHDNLWYCSSFTRSELVQRLQYLEPAWDLRTVYQYNNLMFMLQGVIVEKVTGLSWEENIIERIFKPLGMSHSNLSIESLEESDDAAF